MDGKFIDPNERCPICDKKHVKILECDKDMAVVKCDAGHHWTATLKTGKDK